MVIKALIIDDERPSIEAIQKILTEFCPDVKVLDVSSSPSEGIQKIKNLKPDLVFLDIEMPSLNGFDVLEAIPERNFEVIFITAYDHYAIKAFKVNAIDYVLKPINVKEIILAVNKVKEQLEQKSIANDKYNGMLNDIRNNTSGKIQFSVQNGVEIVDIDSIIRIMADGRYSRVYLNNGSSLYVSKILKDIELELSSPPFFRVHKSHIVNMNFVKKYNLISSYTLELSDGSTIEIARRKKDEFIDFLTRL